MEELRYLHFSSVDHSYIDYSNFYMGGFQPTQISVKVGPIDAVGTARLAVCGPSTRGSRNTVHVLQARFNAKERINREEADQFMQFMQEIWDLAKGSMKRELRSVGRSRRAARLQAILGPWTIPRPSTSNEIDGETEWEVERIQSSGLFQKRTLQYKVKWVSYDTDPGWYNAEIFEQDEAPEDRSDDNKTSPA